MGRFLNAIKGLFNKWVRGIETANPEIVFNQAIDGHYAKRDELIRATAPVLREAKRNTALLESKRVDLIELNATIDQALHEGEDDVAADLMKNQQVLEDQIVDLENSLEASGEQIMEMKKSIRAFEGEAERLKQRKVHAIAQLQNAAAQKRAIKAYEGLSMDTDLKALEELETKIGEQVAEVAMRKELVTDGLDHKVKEIRERAKDKEAQARLLERKKALGLLTEGEDETGEVKEDQPANE